MPPDDDDDKVQSFRGALFRKAGRPARLPPSAARRTRPTPLYASARKESEGEFEFRINRTIWRWDISQKTCSLWISSDVIVLHPGTTIYVPTYVMLKFSGRLAQIFFYINGLSFFSIQHFGLTLPTLGQILTFFGANTAQIKKIYIFWSQNGSPLRDFASFEPLCLKIRQRVWLLRVPQKKKKTITKRYISHIYPDIPREWIVTTFGIWGGPVDLINYTNFWQSIQGFRISV